MELMTVVGARPNFMKAAPLHRAFEQHGFRSRILHTGQHYDREMSALFFEQLDLPEPDLHLGVGSGTHAEQTARIMTRFEAVLDEDPPDRVVVVGDVNSTLACSLVAAKRGVPVAHVEAGLRSGNRRMPEEINRLLTDRLADLLFVTEQSGLEHLRREGVPDERVFFVGNVMIDALVHFRAKARRTPLPDALDVGDGPFALMTMHRPANVDVPERLREVRRLMDTVAAQVPLVFPMHPRTRRQLQDAGQLQAVQAVSGLTLTEPLGYLVFLRLMERAALVVTDSGGIQEETTFLGVPCLTVRPETERPVTIEQGTNELMPLDTRRVGARVREILRDRSDGAAHDASARRQAPPRWDGQAAERIADVLADHAEQKAT